jgi:hypothetical protein
MATWRLPTIVAIIGLGTFVCSDVASAAGRTDWATGTNLQRAMAEPCDILWAGNPLRQAIGSLSTARKVAVLIDRRVDPAQKLDVSLKGIPLEMAIQTIAKGRGLGVAQLGSVVYLGPPAAAEHLPAIAAMLDQDARRLPSSVRQKYRQVKAFAWDDLATPRGLLGQLADQSGLRIKGLELVPHDLWAAGDLPPMTLTDRLALIAVQFDLALKTADRGETVELVSLPQELPRVSQTNRATGRSHPTPRRAATAKTGPSAGVALLPIDHIVVQQQPLRPVLKQLADRLGLELKIDEDAIRAAGISLDQRVSIRVENTTVDELLRRLLQPTGLTFRRRDRLVEILPAEK